MLELTFKLRLHSYYHNGEYILYTFKYIISVFHN